MNEKNVDSIRSQQRPPSLAPVIDFKQLFTLVIVNWKWLVVSLISFILLAGIYLWFTPYSVSVSGKMEIIDKSNKSGGLSAGMAMLSNLPMGLGNALGGSIGGSLGIDSEIEIVKSNSLVRDVVKELDLYTEYRLCKWGRKTLLYKNQPINATIDSAHLLWLDSELPLTFHQIRLTITKDSEGYTVETELKENKKEYDLPDQTFANLPATVKTDAGIITLTENVLTEKQAKLYENGYTVNVIITPPTEAANDFLSRMSVEPPSKKVNNMLKIAFNDGNVMRGIDFVNHIVKAYNKRANDEKNEEARKTDEFVNARLAKIDAELGSSDAAWENSKKNFQITDPAVDAEEVMTKKGLYESKLVEIGTELQLHDYLSEYVQNLDNLYELIPVGFSGGMGDLSGDTKSKESTSSNASLIAQHNTLVSQRKELLRSMSEKAPQIQRLTESIKELHPTLVTAMKRDRQNIVMKRNAVEREYSKYMGRVNTAPKMERVLTEIGRQREIKQGVYLLMLQKREETAMELANTTDKGRLVDETYVSRGSERPQKKMVFVVAAFLGLLLPIGCLYLCQMFKNRIDTRDELAEISNLPILAELGGNNTEEAIRTLRTNLLLNLKEGQKTVLVASNNTGDGKSFIAQRLTDSLAAIDKKAVLINGDLRSQNSSKNAADIIAGAEFVAQVAQAKDANDFVIIDSPAIGDYNDAYQLASYADATLYVVKAGKAQKSVIESLAINKTLPNPLIVFNV